MEFVQRQRHPGERFRYRPASQNFPNRNTAAPPRFSRPTGGWQVARPFRPRQQGGFRPQARPIGQNGHRFRPYSTTVYKHPYSRLQTNLRT